MIKYHLKYSWRHITATCVLAVFLQVAGAQQPANTITLNVKNETLQYVMQGIEAQIPQPIFLPDSLIDSTILISSQQFEIPLFEVLEHVLQPLSLHFNATEQHIEIVRKR